MTPGEGAGRVCLIGVLFSGSLLRDQDRQLTGAWMSNRDSQWTTANSRARYTGKYVIIGLFVMWFWFHSSAAIQLGDKDTLPRWRRSRVWQKERLARSAGIAGFILAQFALGFYCRVAYFPFSCLSRGRIQRKGCSRKCAHATKARMGNKKMAARVARSVWMYSCLVGQNGASAWHRSGARFKRMDVDVAMTQNRGLDDPRQGKYEGRAAGFSADRMRRLERAAGLELILKW